MEIDDLKSRVSCLRKHCIDICKIMMDVDKKLQNKKMRPLPGFRNATNARQDAACKLSENYLENLTPSIEKKNLLQAEKHFETAISLSLDILHDYFSDMVGDYEKKYWRRVPASERELLFNPQTYIEARDAYLIAREGLHSAKKAGLDLDEYICRTVERFLEFKESVGKCIAHIEQELLNSGRNMKRVRIAIISIVAAIGLAVIGWFLLASLGK